MNEDIKKLIERVKSEGIPEGATENLPKNNLQVPESESRVRSLIDDVKKQREEKKQRAQDTFDSFKTIDITPQMERQMRINQGEAVSTRRRFERTGEVEPNKYMKLSYGIQEQSANFLTGSYLGTGSSILSNLSRAGGIVLKNSDKIIQSLFGFIPITGDFFKEQTEEQLEKILEKINEKTGFFDKLEIVGENLKDYADETDQTTQRQLKKVLGEKGVNSLSTQMGMGVGQMIGQLSAAFINPIVGTAYTGTVISTAVDQGYKQAYEHVLEETGSEEEAERIANKMGIALTGVYSLEFLPVFRFMKNVPGVDKLLSGISRRGLSKLMKDNQMTSHLVRGGSQMLIESGTEFTQEFGHAWLANQYYDAGRVPLEEGLMAGLISLPAGALAGGASVGSNIFYNKKVQEEVTKIKEEMKRFAIEKGLDPETANSVVEYLVNTQLNAEKSLEQNVMQSEVQKNIEEAKRKTEIQRMQEERSRTEQAKESQKISEIPKIREAQVRAKLEDFYQQRKTGDPLQQAERAMRTTQFDFSPDGVRARNYPTAQGFIQASGVKAYGNLADGVLTSKKDGEAFIIPKKEYATSKEKLTTEQVQQINDKLKLDLPAEEIRPQTFAKFYDDVLQPNIELERFGLTPKKAEKVIMDVFGKRGYVRTQQGQARYVPINPDSIKTEAQLTEAWRGAHYGTGKLSPGTKKPKQTKPAKKDIDKPVKKTDTAKKDTDKPTKETTTKTDTAKKETTKTEKPSETTTKTEKPSETKPTGKAIPKTKKELQQLPIEEIAPEGYATIGNKQVPVSEQKVNELHKATAEKINVEEGMSTHFQRLNELINNEKEFFSQPYEVKKQVDSEKKAQQYFEADPAGALEAFYKRKELPSDVEYSALYHVLLKNEIDNGNMVNADLLSSFFSSDATQQGQNISYIKHIYKDKDVRVYFEGRQIERSIQQNRLGKSEKEVSRAKKDLKNKSEDLLKKAENDFIEDFRKMTPQEQADEIIKRFMTC